MILDKKLCFADAQSSTDANSEHVIDTSVAI